MKLLPFVKYELESDFGINEIRERLRENIDIRQSFFNFSYPKNVFHGSLDSSSFKISKTLKRQKNSFLPVVIGSFYEQGKKTRIHVKMRLDISVIIFLTLWLSGTGGTGLVLLIGSLLSGTFEGFVLVPLGMFAFGATLTLLAFHNGKKKSIVALKEILRAKEIIKDSQDPLSPIQRL